MSDCKSRSPTGLLASGRSAKSYDKALKRALKSFLKQGRAICMPGNCAESGGGSCGFRVTTITASYDVIIIGADQELDYIVSLNGSGECRCE